MEYRPETGEFVLNPGDMALLQTTRMVWPTTDSDALLTLVGSADKRMSAIDTSEHPGTTGQIEKIRAFRNNAMLAGMRRVIAPHVHATEEDYRKLLGEAS